MNSAGEAVPVTAERSAVFPVAARPVSSGFLRGYRLWTRCRARLFSLLCSGAFHSFGRKSVIMPPLRVGGETHIAIGKQVFIGPGSWLQVIATDEELSSPVVQIGDGTRIVGSCTITAARSVIIEKNVLMAARVYVSDHIHAHGSRTVPIVEQGIAGIRPVRIREGAWIGQNVVICPGVTIGRNAVIGANSVVRKDVPDFCVAAGAPARVIREVDQTVQK